MLYTLEGILISFNHYSLKKLQWFDLEETDSKKRINLTGRVHQIYARFLGSRSVHECMQTELAI